MKYSFAALDSPAREEVLSIPSGRESASSPVASADEGPDRESTRQHRTQRRVRLAASTKLKNLPVTIKEHPSPAQRPSLYRGVAGGGGPELVTVILLHTHRRKLSLLDSAQYAGVLPYPGILTDATAQSQELSTRISQYCLQETELWAPQAARYFRVPPSEGRMWGLAVFSFQTSCVIGQPDALTAYFITERKSDCGEMREYASQN